MQPVVGRTTQREDESLGLTSFRQWDAMYATVSEQWDNIPLYEIQKHE
jgi:hypothetical protein